MRMTGNSSTHQGSRRNVLPKATSRLSAEDPAMGTSQAGNRLVTNRTFANRNFRAVNRPGSQPFEKRSHSGTMASTCIPKGAPLGGVRTGPHIRRECTVLVMLRGLAKNKYPNHLYRVTELSSLGL